MKRVAALLVLAACSSYGDGDTPRLPDRNSASSSGTTGDGGISQTSSSSSGDVPPGVDGGGTSDGSALSFCKTDAAKDAIRCLDFEDLPKRPFGFDQIFGNDDTVHLAPFPNGTMGFLAASKPLAAYGVFDALPQDDRPIALTFDIAVQAVTGSPLIGGVIGAGPSCPPESGSLGVLATAGGDGVSFSVTNFPGSLGSAKLGDVVHLSLQANKRPGPGKTITTQVQMNNGVGVQVEAKLPLGCVNFSAAVGSTGVFGNGSATATFDNVLLK